jgi:NAD(P)-dependent dehydrogenase (short-subunit alcohol dehydrogenase family)
VGDRLKDKVALVVGAGSIGPGWGNGKATAVAFAREGARVFCADIDEAAAEETAAIIKREGGEAVAHCADVTKATDVAAMVAVCASAYGRIDVPTTTSVLPKSAASSRSRKTIGIGCSRSISRVPT